ncbi:MAG: hypothetical protein AB7F41_10655 [Methylocystis sp.]|uniref:hypothetical protein n=1 Tax=Methylocystis sp. TaxID=1911079 RepID=UPI003D0BF4D6
MVDFPTLQNSDDILAYIQSAPAAGLSDSTVNEEYRHWTRQIEAQWTAEQLRSEIKDPGDDLLDWVGGVLTVLGFPVLALNYVFGTFVSGAGLVLFGLSKIDKARDRRARKRTRDAVRLVDERRTALMNEAIERAQKRNATSASITP